jgi:NAD+ synthase
MAQTYRIALAQLNPVMGDIAGNLARARSARAKAMGADVILFPELFIVGYSPEDLVLKPALQADARAAVEELARDTADGGPAILIGTPWVEHAELYNAVALLDGGKVAGLTYKYELPNYGVFDEKRVFARGPVPEPMTVRGVKLGVPICEDIWKQDVTIWLADAGAEIFCVPNGSPFEAGKEDVRLKLAAARIQETGVPLIYLNQLGGQDEVVYDGASFVLNADGTIAAALRSWEECVIRHRMDAWTAVASGSARAGDRFVAGGSFLPGLSRHDAGAARLCEQEPLSRRGCWVCRAASIRPSRRRWRWMRWVAERVRCVMLPSRYTSRESLEDADACARMLGVTYETIEIERAVAALGETLAAPFAGTKADTTEENLQSRPARGDPDGAVQQVRPHGADHRQQERDERGLCHPLWRHVRRL